MNQNYGDVKLIQKTQGTEQLSIGGYGRLRLLGKPGALQKSHCLPAGVRESAPHRESASPSESASSRPARRTDSVLDNYVTVTKRAAAAARSSTRQSGSSCSAPATPTASRGTQCAPGTSSRARAAASGLGEF